MASKAPKPIRNLTHVSLNIRFGSKRDPYYITLKPRGLRGDVHFVPAELMTHPAFLNSQGKSFEIITKTEAEKIVYDDSRPNSHPIYDGIKVETVRMAEAEKTVARFKLNDKGQLISHERVDRMQGPLRADEIVGPAPAQVPGSIGYAGLHGAQMGTASATSSNADIELPGFKGVEKA